MKRAKGKLIVAAALVVVWVLLAYPLEVAELGIAAVIALFIALLPLGSESVFGDIRLTPKAFLYALAYLGVFTLELTKANFDVASRVVQPALPIRPGIVEVRTKLSSRLGRLILANSITLTPGTITVDTADDTFYVHWIAVDTDDPEAATREIVRKFEPYLEVICG